jgi:hypothetical protein
LKIGKRLPTLRKMGGATILRAFLAPTYLQPPHVFDGSFLSHARPEPDAAPERVQRAEAPPPEDNRNKNDFEIIEKILEFCYWYCYLSTKSFSTLEGKHKM